jgi:dephospho-CoA kinase
VRAIMRTQVTRAARLAAADDVIDNAGSRDALRNQVAALHQKYLQFAKP